MHASIRVSILQLEYILLLGQPAYEIRKNARTVNAIADTVATTRTALLNGAPSIRPMRKRLR